ncbi:MscS Mechanosensitive ion channel [Thioploca ingrica]|uniref:MscS Mechanosensitive ion channel n=1 Tax=Thioploca ingrica TaxID=40754 RepID=A0A090AJJ8_9GAMM|nr:MscS Mechanosensitive ion channel [Thioploca ingrica]
MKLNVIMLGLLILVVLIGALYQSYFKPKEETIYVAFIGPMSEQGKSETEPTAGQIMARAVELYFEEINKKRDKLKGKKIELIRFDDKNECATTAKDEAERIVAENQVLAVIGHWYSSCSTKGGETYKKYGIPAITPGSVDPGVTKGNEWYFRNIYTTKDSGQFLAYYVNKILKLNQVTIIHETASYGAYLAKVFKETANQLQMQVQNEWAFEPNNPQQKEEFSKFVEQLKNNKDQAGAIFLSVQASEGVELVKLIKSAGITNPILGESSFSEQTFVNGFNDFAEEKANPGHYTNDIYVATPLLFDTANEKAQLFKDAYQKKYHNDPDWSAAYAYDTAMILVKAISEAGIKGEPTTLATDRQKIRDKLASYTNSHDALEGTTGFNYFDENRNAQKPVAIGVYKNKQLISALTQFQVVRNPNEISDLDQAVQDERVLLIDNKYMYKTNVVYTGIKINEISDFDLKTLTFNLDFDLWFRFQGDRKTEATLSATGNANSKSETEFKPQQIEFSNGIGEMEFVDNKPEMQRDSAKGKTNLDKANQGIMKLIDSKEKDRIQYHIYKVRSRFRADFLTSQYAYKQHILGVQFHHRYFTRNNLIYVTDLLGMGSDPLKTMKETQVLSPASGWLLDQVRFFQDVAKKFSLGDPNYLNVQGGTIEYSRFNAGIEIKKNEFTLRGTIPERYAYNLLISSIIVILVLNIFSKKFRHLSKLVWFLQAILAFILLLSGEVLLIKGLADQLDIYEIKSIIRIFDILWWLIPAFLLNLASESFIWTPIEEKTGRLIPNIVRLFLAFIIYFLAVVGIIAFVYEQQLTSILATSGVIAMIIGLAIQINISNIFSGIAINIERPFRIGDWVKIGSYEEGEIVDITWRTTRIRNRADCILSIPNSIASESAILNFCYPDDTYWLWPTVYVHPMHPPARVKKILLDALLSAEKVLKDPEPVVIFTGINEWAASYWIAFCADDYASKFTILEDVWTRVWFHLNRAGITPAVQRQEIHWFKGIKERGGEEATKPITLLQEIDIFKPFSEKAKFYLSERIGRQRFQAHETIVKQGDRGNSLFIIVEGVVSVQVLTEEGKNKEVARLGAGNFFGEMALLTGEDRTATVVALVDTYLFELTKTDIKPLLEEQPEVSEMISKVLTQRQLSTISQIHEQHDIEIETEAVYKRFLNRIENFFGLGERQ